MIKCAKEYEPGDMFVFQSPGQHYAIQLIVGVMHDPHTLRLMVTTIVSWSDNDRMTIMHYPCAPHDVLWNIQIE